MKLSATQNSSKFYEKKFKLHNNTSRNFSVSNLEENHPYVPLHNYYTLIFVGCDKINRNEISNNSYRIREDVRVEDIRTELKYSQRPTEYTRTVKATHWENEEIGRQVIN